MMELYAAFALRCFLRPPQNVDEEDYKSLFAEI